MNAKDRELLELAAKAAGISVQPVVVRNIRELGDGEFVGYRADPDQCQRGWFNPLADDGDALRLAVKLKIEIAPQVFAMSRVDVRTKGDRWIWEQYSNHGDDAQKATRRAIVRAAAEIGREKQ